MGCGFAVATAPIPSRSCSGCGTTFLAGAQFCGNCGTEKKAGNSPPTVTPVSIRAQLRRHDKHVELNCLECGYGGLMGVVKKESPWWTSWFLIIPLIFCPIGWILLFLRIVMDKKHTTICPACLKTLVQTA